MDCYKCINGLYDEDCLVEPETCQEGQVSNTTYISFLGRVMVPLHGPMPLILCPGSEDERPMIHV